MQRAAFVMSVAAFASLAATDVWAQTSTPGSGQVYPSKPIRMLFGGTPGSGAGDPAVTPKDIIAKLNGAIVKGINTPETREALTRMGIEAQTGTPEHFGAFIRNELVQNAKVVRFAGIKVE